MRRGSALFGAVALSALFACNAVSAAEFYEGKLIRIVTGGNVGGGYDTHTRLVGDYLSRYIPGHPGVIVQNMPEGSGIGAANYEFNAAKRDGTEIGQFNRDALTLSLLGNNLAKFKLDQFNWIGSPADYSKNVFVVVIRSALPYKTMDDLRKASVPINFGNMGTVFAELVPDAMGAKVKVIEGYKGDMALALQRGEIDGLVIDYALIKGFHPDWIANHFVRIIAQFGGAQRSPELADVPTAQELAQTPSDLALIKFCELTLHLGFPFAAPPEVPADRIDGLRKAFYAMVNDPDYVAAIGKAKLEHSPVSGERLRAQVLEAIKASPETLARFKDLAALGGRG